MDAERGNSVRWAELPREAAWKQELVRLGREPRRIAYLSASMDYVGGAEWGWVPHLASRVLAAALTAFWGWMTWRLAGSLAQARRQAVALFTSASRVHKASSMDAG